LKTTGQILKDREISGQKDRGQVSPKSLLGGITYS